MTARDDVRAPSTPAVALSLVDGRRRLPGGVVVHMSAAEGLELRWSWRGWQNTGGMAGFCAFLGGIMLSGRLAAHPPSAVWWIGLGTGLAIGVYALLAEILNRSRVRVAHGRLTAVHGPVPTQHLRTVDVDVRALVQVSTCRSRVRDFRGWEVAIVSRDVSAGDLVIMRVATQEQARAVRQVLEQHLALDRPR